MLHPQSNPPRTTMHVCTAGMNHATQQLLVLLLFSLGVLLPPASSARIAGDTRKDGAPQVELLHAKSDFSNGIDGWELLGDARALRAESGALSASDDGSSLWFFSAPVKFLGDVSDSFGATLTYSLGHYHSDSAGKQPAQVEDVVLISDTFNMTLIRSGLIAPWIYSSTLTVRLEGGGEWQHALTGDTCGDHELKRALSSLSGLLIRGGHYHGKETTWLRDVSLNKLRTAPPTPKAPGPSPSIDSVLPPSLAYSAGGDTNILAPPPPITRQEPSPLATLLTTKGDDPNAAVSRELFNSMKELKDELEASEKKMRNMVADLQGRLSASNDEAMRLRQALVEAKDQANRNGELADARTRNLNHCEASLEEIREEKSEVVKRLEVSETLRKQKQAVIENLQIDSQGKGELERSELKLHNCSQHLRRAHDNIADLQANVSALNETIKANHEASERARVDLQVCESKLDGCRGEADGVENKLLVPMQQILSQLAKAEADVRDRDQKLARACLTRQGNVMNTIVCLLLLPFGVIVVMALPTIAVRGRTNGFLTRLASVGSLVVLLTWLSTAAYLSYRKEWNHARAELTKAISQWKDGELMMGWLNQQLDNEDAPANLHLAGGVLYGVVVGSHLVALMVAPSLVGTLQAFGFWGVGLHYYSLWHPSSDSEGIAAPDAPHEVYIAALVLLTSLSSLTNPVSPPKNPRQPRAKAPTGWRPAGAEAPRRRTRRRVDDDLDVGLSASSDEEYSDEDFDVPEEEETALRFPPDQARDTKEQLGSWVDDFFAKYPIDKHEKQLQGANGKHVAVSKQFRRDVPTMVRVNGKLPQGDDDDQRTLDAFEAISEACGKLGKGKKKAEKGKSVEEVMGFANQNLGIFLYEAVVNRYQAEDSSVSVMQAGHHYIDIQVAEPTGLVVTLIAYFKLHNAEDLAITPWLIQACISVDVGKGLVSTEFSKPVPSPADPGAAIEAMSAAQ